jgi:surface protein
MKKTEKMKFNNDTLWDAVGEWIADTKQAQEKYGNISKWDTSKVTNMAKLFSPPYHSGAGDLNVNISNWDVSKVKTMNGMFLDNKVFNKDISEWNVSGVKNMSSMFSGSSSFNQDISKWNVSKVTHMLGMFAGAIKFNKPIGDWDVSNVESMNSMFSGAMSFNQDISRWNVESCMFMKNMFSNTEQFNQDISKWNVKKVEFMTEMFMDSESFNKDISKWDFGRVQNMDRMFNGSKSFNQDLSSWTIEKFGSRIIYKKPKKPSGMFTNAISMDKKHVPFNLKITIQKHVKKSLEKSFKTKKDYSISIASGLKQAASNANYEKLIIKLKSAKTLEAKSKIIDKMTVEQRKRFFSFMIKK